MSGHPRDAKKVFVTETGRFIREFENSAIAREVRKTGFCEDLRGCSLGELFDFNSVKPRLTATSV